MKDVELAAVEAAAEHERFAAERVRSAAEALFRDVQAAWDARDSERLATLLGPDLSPSGSAASPTSTPRAGTAAPKSSET